MDPVSTLPKLLGLAWLLPLASFTAIVFFGPRMGKAGSKAGYLATAAILTSCVLSVFALFFVFQNTIELRGASFLWLPDLARPDPYYIIPIVMGLSMFGLSKVGQMGMPPNPQARMIRLVQGLKAHEETWTRGDSVPGAVRPVEERDQRVVIDGLGQVVIEAGGEGALAVLLLAVARDGDDRGLLGRLVAPQLPDDLVAVQAGQADVQEDEPGSESARRLDPRRPVIGRLHVMSEQAQQPGQRLGEVDVVIDDQDPGPRRRIRLGRGCRLGRGLLDEGR